MTEYIKIPIERIAVLVGPKGSTKKLIEELSTAKINIDSQTGSVEISDIQDPIKAMRTKEVIKAIGRGFNPEKAIKLFEDEMLMFDIIDLSDITRSERDMKRIKGRIIGKDGQTREIFETLLNVRISVYGKTISIIGYPQEITAARTGIEMLLNGAPHGPVYKFLEKKRDEIRQSQSQAL